MRKLYFRYRNRYYLEEENAENVVAEKPKAHTILVVEDNEELFAVNGPAAET
mgnify:CR=1 FL=1